MTHLLCPIFSQHTHTQEQLPCFSREVFWPPDSRFSVSFQPHPNVEKKFPLLIPFPTSNLKQEWTMWSKVKTFILTSTTSVELHPLKSLGFSHLVACRDRYPQEQVPTSHTLLPPFSLLFTSFSSAGHVSHSLGLLK